MFPMPGSNPQTAKQSAKNRGLDPRQLGMGSAQSRQDSYATATPYGQQMGYRGPSLPKAPKQQQPVQAPPAVASMPVARPTQQGQPQMGYRGPQLPAFEQLWGDIGGGYGQSPNFAQRDAFISQINSQLGQMQQQSWNQPMGAPQFNFPQMWQQAGQMVQQGWQNPFARQ